MATYVARRLLIAIPILLGISVLVFVFVALTPGDPVTAYLRPEQATSPQIRAIIAHQLGLDQPLPTRYVLWLSQTLQGNLGYGVVSGVPVSSLVWTGLLASATLMGAALIIGIALGIPLGIVSSLRQYSKLDHGLTAAAFLGISTPSFLLGIGALYVFGLTLGWFPIGGMQEAAVPFTLPDFLRHLALPALVLGVGYVAILTRYTRAAMLDVINNQHITTAEAKGLPRRVVVSRHAFRNALIPIITVIGLALPDMVGGAVITETVFAWPGMGLRMVDAVSARDFPVIMGISLAIAVAVLAANLLTDVTYAAVDPRVRY
jgi:peptide/nickel transport system permease protein